MTSNTPNTLLRQLPSISKLLETTAGQNLSTQFGAELTTETLRQTLTTVRQTILNHDQTILPTLAEILQDAQRQLTQQTSSTLHDVINATGIIIHTNLGRATLSQDAQQAISAAAANYTNLEFDIPSGKRGKRDSHAEHLVQQVTGAESALFVNNTAAAVMMMLSTFCQGKEVIISRGQLVEIGGGFRVPDVMAQSGAIIREVGTTNRTHLRDYANAINENTAAIMLAHHSNFRIIGFTTEPPIHEIAQLAKQHNIPLIYDQGSGCLLDTANYGLIHEPTVQEGVEAGCDLIAFSGDKLLGGPQAGIICGRTDLVQTLKRHPLARALRPDKLCLAGLAATLSHYAKNEAEQAVPIWRMTAMTLAEIETRATNWVQYLQREGISAAVQDSTSAVGGGSLPGTTLPTKVVAISHPKVEQLAANLRQTSPHIIGRIQENQLLLDPRTVFPTQEDALLSALCQHAK